VVLDIWLVLEVFERCLAAVDVGDITVKVFVFEVVTIADLGDR
jgi:hypothetical protein